MVNVDFADWLQGQLNERGWSQSDLSRASGLTTAAISRILTNSRGVGKASCNAIARALKLPTEAVYRAAGLLPPVSERDALIEQITNDLDRLSPRRRQQVLDFIRFLASQQSPEGSEEARS